MAESRQKRSISQGDEVLVWLCHVPACVEIDPEERKEHLRGEVLSMNDGGVTLKRPTDNSRLFVPMGNIALIEVVER